MPSSNIKIVITEKMIDEANTKVLSSFNYGKEDELITDCLKRFPYNNDKIIVAMKIGLIDITNNTHLGQHKSLISVPEFADVIISIKDIDQRIKNGDPSVVNEIARANGKINLFSFASKYCCYHNANYYENDAYSIFDTVLKKNLSKYFSDISESKLEKWRKAFDYESYNKYIGEKLKELGITCTQKRRKFDRYIWYKNR